MKCMICSKNFKYLGVHIRHHGMTAREYKIQFNIPLLKPLCSKEVRDKMSDAAVARTYEDGYLKNLLKMQKKYAPKSPTGKRELPECTREKSKSAVKIAKREQLKQKKARIMNVIKIPGFIKDYKSGMMLKTLCKKYDISTTAFWEWRKNGYI